MKAPKRHLPKMALLVWLPLLALPGLQAQAQTPPDGYNAYNYTRTTSYSYYLSTDPDGAKKAGQLKSETVEPNSPQLATVTSYDYDLNSGNRSSVTTANAPGATGQALFATRSTSTAYGAVAGQLIKVGNNSNVSVNIPPGLFATTQTVDPSNLAFSETRRYDPRFGAVLSLQGPNGLTTSWQYDDFGRVTKELRADGTSTVTAYCIIAGQGVDTSSNSSTNNGDPLGCFAPPSGETLADTMMFVHSVPLDKNGVVMGSFLRIYTDSLGREVRRVTQSYDGSGQASGKAGVAIYTDTTYNQYGAKAQQSQPYFASSVSSTTGGANDVGVTWTMLDALGRPTAVYTADPKGLGGTQSFASATNGGTNYGPNLGSRTVAVTRFAYSGLKTTTTNDKGQRRTEETDPIGQLAIVTDASGATLIHQRDAFGNLTRTVDALGNVTTLSYDYRGRKTQLRDPDTGEWNYAYNALGEVVWQQSPNQRNATPPTQTTLVYDQLGRLTSRAEPEYTSTWRYDKNADDSSCMAANPAQGKGKLCQSSTSTDVSRQYNYDDKGRPTHSRTSMTNGPSFTSAVSYEPNTGRTASQTYPSGLKVNYAYTTLGYSEKLVLGTAANLNPLPNAQGVRAANTSWAAGSVLWQGMVVNAWGQAEQQRYGNGVTNRAVFEAATGRVTDLLAGLSASPSKVLAQHYSWDSLSNLMSRVDDNGDESNGVSTGAVSETFTYGDALNRLTTYRVAAPAIPNLSRTVELRYSALGMLLSKSDVGNYSYGVQGGGVGTKPHAVQSVVGSYSASYGYDANGNVTSATAGKYRSVSYTSFNLPDSGLGLQGPSGSPKYTWQYDENHSRIKETRVNASGTRTTWYLGGGFESETAPNGTQSQRHLLSVGGQVIGALVSTGALPPLGTGQTAPTAPSGSINLVKVEYWHKDHLGSLISTSDHTGAVTARYAYDPFGKRRYTNGSYDAAGNVVVDWSTTLNAGTDKGFTGHEQLDDVGVVHMNGRLFDPTLGLFMQPNPNIHDASDLQAYNRYSYCDNNPLTCTDPTGLQGVRPRLAASAIRQSLRQGAMVQVGVYIASASYGLTSVTSARAIGLLGNQVQETRVVYTPEELAVFAAAGEAQEYARYRAQSASQEQANREAQAAAEQLVNNAKAEFSGFNRKQDQLKQQSADLRAQLRPLVEQYLEQGGTGGAAGFRQWLNELADQRTRQREGVQVAANGAGGLEYLFNSTPRTQISIGYTDTPIGMGTSHALVIATDLETGEQYATRAGPSIGAGQGSGNISLGYIYAQSGLYDETFRDRPSAVRDVQVVGELNVSLSNVALMMNEFASVTNQARVSYQGFSFNSNSYAFTFVESLGFQRPAPVGVWAPGWQDGTPSSRLTYVEKK